MGQIFVRASRRAKAYTRSSIVARAHHKVGYNVALKQASKATSASGYQKAIRRAGDHIDKLGKAAYTLQQKIYKGGSKSRHGMTGTTRLLKKYNLY